LLAESVKIIRGNFQLVFSDKLLEENGHSRHFSLEVLESLEGLFAFC
jgi:hypothetical protein